MFSRRVFCASLVGALFIVATSRMAAAQTAAPPKTVRLLTVGNSFSGDATRLLGKIAEADGNTLIMHTVSIGGGSLQQHWDKAALYDKDPHDPKALYTSGHSLDQELHAEPWDYVTIQQASILSHDPKTYRPFAGQLFAYIKKRVPQAEILIHETWAHRRDDSRFASTTAGKPSSMTQQTMYEDLSRAYDDIAKELGGLHILPVGDAFHRADTDPVWGFKPDPNLDKTSFISPKLPEQTHSLHVGWYWKKTPNGAPTLTQDGHHASVAGQYLAACVFYETLFGKSAEDNRFVPKGIEPGYAHFLQKTAHEAVQNRKSLGNL